MIFKTIVVPQNGQKSNYFNTEGRPIVGLTHFVSSFDGSPTVIWETPQVGNDPENASAVWLPVREISPGARHDADDQGTLAQELVRDWLFMPNELLAEGGNDFYLVNTLGIPLFLPMDVTPTTVTEGEVQHAHNGVARLNNKLGRDMRRVPNILRLAIGVNQTTAARTFIVALGELQPPKLPNHMNLPIRTTTVSFANGDADSTYFELGPGERLVGLYLPAAFTTTDITLQAVKPSNGGYLDASVITDANWLDLVDWIHDKPSAASITPKPVLFLSQVAQATYRVVEELPYYELPRYMRLHGSGNQGAARTVTLVIETATP